MRTQTFCLWRNGKKANGEKLKCWNNRSNWGYLERDCFCDAISELQEPGGNEFSE